MYQPTSLQQFYQQLGLAIEEIFQGSGYGQLRLFVKPHDGNASRIRLENTIHQGFELNASDVQMLLMGQLSAVGLRPALSPIWQPLHHKLEIILAQSGHGSILVSFKRTRNNSRANVIIGEGVSYLVQLPAPISL